MNDLRRASRLAAFLPLALAIAACGGSTASSSPAGSTGTGPSAAPTSAGATSSAGAGGPSIPPIGVLPSFDTSAILAGLSKVDSYQETITVDGEQVFAATVITKPVLARSITVQGGAKIVIIGDKAWQSSDGTTFVSVPTSLVSSMIGAFDPSLMIGAFGSAAWGQAATDVGSEQKNGVNAHHYSIDSSSPFAAQMALPAGAKIDIWVADEGYLVAVETTGMTGGKDMQIEVTNVDDPSNKVDEPG